MVQLIIINPYVHYHQAGLFHRQGRNPAPQGARNLQRARQHPRAYRPQTALDRKPSLVHHQGTHQAKPRPEVQSKPHITEAFDDLSPIVTAENNFDMLNVPKDHSSRSKSDTYYVNNTHLLRTHTSAHQKDHLASGLNHFAVFGTPSITKVTSIAGTRSIASTTQSSTRWRRWACSATGTESASMKL